MAFAQNTQGDTALHQVVYGDSYPFNNCNYGLSHCEVAKYLLAYSGELTIKNNNQQTPYDCTKWCAPLYIENMLGRRFITNTGSALYYADKVRPIFEKRLKKLEQASKDSTFVVLTTRVRQAKSYEDFLAEYAIGQYVKNGAIPYGYLSENQFSERLDHLTEKEWQHFRMIISSQRPAPYSFKYGIINNQLIKITKQSAAFGLAAALTTYYLTKSILLAVTTGILSAVFAWQCLTEMAYKAKVEKRNTREERVGNLLQHDGFFKPTHVELYQINNLRNMQARSEQLREALNMQFSTK